MTIRAGARLGPYEVGPPIGAGGMGQVFQAKDTRLNRSVAIKILPPHLTSDPQSRERLNREAKAISSLNHPHICTLHDIGHQDGIDYLVMELVDGETLADRIARGPLPLRQVLRYGAEIAEALGQAHRAGIVHRDLKPGNIMITGSGVKLLDFGLAKLIAPTGQHSPDQSAVTARFEPLTAQGAIIGTLQYMSPEQIEGKLVDHRTDIFSLGMILHEMGTGQRAFSAASPAGLMSAILSSDPAPVRSLDPSLPQALERIILTALQKNPEERWQTAQDVARQLRWAGESSPSGEHAVPQPRKHGILIPLSMIVAIAVAAALILWARELLSPAASEGISHAHLHVSLPPSLVASNLLDNGSFALSPDGRMLCFAATGDGVRSLYLRRIDSFEVQKVEGTESASGVFWSSDGEWIGFSARGKLWKVLVSGSTPPEAILDVSTNGVSGSWNGRTILFANAPGDRSGLYRVSDSGGAAVPVTTLADGEWTHAWPSLLPDGNHFLYQAFRKNSIERDLVLGSFDSKSRKVLLKNVSKARLAGAERLIYVRDGVLLTQRFDLSRGELEGSPVSVARDVRYFYPTGHAEFDASPAGVIAYRTNTRTTRLSMMDRSGVETKVIDDEGPITWMGISFDGRKLAAAVADRATELTDIWIYDLDTTLRDRLTSEPGIEANPLFSPDGRSVVYSQGAVGTVPYLVRRALDGSPPETLTPPGEFRISGSFSPDGKFLYTTKRDAKRRTDILRLNLLTKESEELIATDFYEGDPAVSPDGKWLAYVSDVSGSLEVYVQSLEGERPQRIRISRNGGERPRWRRDGRELFFLGAERRVMSATVPGPGRWNEARVETLFGAPGQILEFEVQPEGQTFLVLQGSPGPMDSLFHLILGARQSDD